MSAVPPPSRLRRPSVSSSAALLGQTPTANTGLKPAARPGPGTAATKPLANKTNTAHTTTFIKPATQKKPITGVENSNQVGRKEIVTTFLPSDRKPSIDQNISFSKLKSSYEGLLQENIKLEKVIKELEKEIHLTTEKNIHDQERSEAQLREKELEIETLKSQLQCEKQRNSFLETEWQNKFDAFCKTKQQEILDIVETQTEKRERLEADLQQAKDRLLKSDRKLEELGIDPETLCPFQQSSSDERRRMYKEEQERIVKQLLDTQQALRSKFDLMQKVYQNSNLVRMSLEEEIQKADRLDEGLSEFEHLTQQYSFAEEEDILQDLRSNNGEDNSFEK